MYPFLIFGAIIFVLINYGVKYRIYQQHIKHGRTMGLTEKLGIDLEDVESYPKAVQQLYLDKVHYDK